MSQSLKHLISERGFDSFRDGLEARFRAHSLSFRIHYSEGSPLPSLLVCLENAERAGEVCVWESGHCDITAGSLADGEAKDRHVVLETAEGFHEQLAALFLYVTKREWTQAA
jgi:hypothetical protein